MPTLVLLGLITFGCILSIAGLWWLFVRVPGRQRTRWEREGITDPKARFEVEDAARSNALNLVARLAAIGVFAFTIMQFNQTQRSANENLRVAEEGQRSERFTRAIDQIAAPKSDRALDVRLGGIYSLERISNVSVQDHWPIVQVLSAYVRRRWPWRGRVGAGAKCSRHADASSVSSGPPPPDMVAVLNVIRRRDVRLDPAGEAIDLSGTDLSEVSLRRAPLARTDLSGSGLALANLRGANLTRAKMNSTILDVADMPHALLTGADLGFARARAADFDNANLRNATLIDACFRRAYLSGARLQRANMDGADLRGAKMRDADASDAMLTEANLSGTYLEDSDFSRADLTDAILAGADLQGTRFDGARLEGADLSGARGTRRGQFRNAVTDHRTRLPSAP